MRKHLFFLICLQIVVCGFLSAKEHGFLETREESFKVSTADPLEVFIDVDAGEISVAKSQSEREGKVTFHYDIEMFRSRYQFFEEKNRVRISLDKRDWKKWSFKNDKDDEDMAELEVLLPDGVDIYLDTKLKAGETSMQLGGLRLKEFSLNNWAGEVKIQFQEPNPIVMEFLDIHNKVGEMELLDLGNARFERAEINGGIGQIKVYFHGAILDESMAKVDLDIGETEVFLPSDIGVRMFVGSALGFLSQKDIDSSFYRRGRYYITENYKTEKRKFSLRITPGLGELNVERE